MSDLERELEKWAAETASAAEAIAGRLHDVISSRSLSPAVASAALAGAAAAIVYMHRTDNTAPDAARAAFSAAFDSAFSDIAGGAS